MAAIPTPYTPNRPGPRTPTLDTTTPPIVKGRSWLGVDPKQKMTGKLAQQGLQGYYGKALSAEQQAEAARYINYTDPTGDAEMSGADYNRLLARGAELTGNTYTPYSTTAGPNDGPPPPTDPGAPPPDLDLPTYQKREDFAYTGADLANDPSYLWRKAEGERALTHRASAMGGVRGGNFMRDLVDYGQNAASDEFNAAYGRAADTYDRNVGGDRYAYEAASSEAQTEYAPKLLGWQRDQRQREMDFDREWQREIYGRDDSWRRHTYANDDAWRRYQLEEERRWKLANGGNQ